jgi:hypothetical protein
VFSNCYVIGRVLFGGGKGWILQQDGFDTLEDFRGLRRVRAGAHFEIDVRGGNAI